MFDIVDLLNYAMRIAIAVMVFGFLWLTGAHLFVYAMLTIVAGCAVMLLFARFAPLSWVKRFSGHK